MSQMHGADMHGADMLSQAVHDDGGTVRVLVDDLIETVLNRRSHTTPPPVIFVGERMQRTLESFPHYDATSMTYRGIFVERMSAPAEGIRIDLARD